MESDDGDKTALEKMYNYGIKKNADIVAANLKRTNLKGDSIGNFNYDVGNYAYCADCGTETVTREIIPATGHTEIIIVEGQAPTCTEDGYVRAVCSDCREVVSEKILLATGGVGFLSGVILAVVAAVMYEAVVLLERLILKSKRFG